MPKSRPRWVTRTIHVQNRLEERYGLRVSFDTVRDLSEFIRREMDEAGVYTAQTMLNGERVIVIRGRDMKQDATAYLVSWAGAEIAFAYAPDTKCLATALPSHVVESMKAQVLVSTGVHQRNS